MKRWSREWWWHTEYCEFIPGWGGGNSISHAAAAILLGLTVLMIIALWGLGLS